MSISLILLIAAIVLLGPTAYAGIIGAPYAPTFRPAYRRAFEYIKLGQADTIVDLGSGDGKVILAAARRGATGIGYELSPIFWFLSFIRGLGNQKVSFRMRNFYKLQLPAETTVVFAFLMPEHMDEIKQLLAKQTLPHAKYFLAYAFPLPEAIKPLHIVHEPKTARLYIYDLKSLVKESN